MERIIGTPFWRCQRKGVGFVCDLHTQLSDFIDKTRLPTDVKPLMRKVLRIVWTETYDPLAFVIHLC